MLRPLVVYWSHDERQVCVSVKGIASWHNVHEFDGRHYVRFGVAWWQVGTRELIPAFSDR